MKVSRKVIELCALAIGLCLLCGCQLTGSVEDLLTLPQLPLEYAGLSQRIDQLIAAGYEYASPTSGRNIQTVQMVDLDGDDVEEAIAFFRKSSDEKALKIVVFSQEEDTYSEICTIESSGTAVESVSYHDLTGDGVKEMIVGWKIGTDVQTVAVYEVAEEPVTLLQSSYTKFTVQKMASNEADAVANLLVLRTDAEGNSIAELYKWEKDSMAVASHCALSVTMAELNRGSITAGELPDGMTAVYVTGVNDQATAVTDILVCRQGALINIVENRTTGLSDLVYPYHQISPQDIDGDGAIEIPIPQNETWDKQGEGLISWRRYGESGEGQWCADTYHSLAGGWYFMMDSDWRGRVSTRVSDNGASENQMVLLVDEQPVVSIYTISGENRENRAVRGNRFVLRRQTAVVYAAELLESSADYEVDEAFVRNRFHLIVGTWGAAEN